MAALGKDTLDQYTMSDRRMIHDRVLLNVLVQAYEHAGTEFERDRVSKAYQDYFGCPYDHMGQALQIGLMGPPGHGKSSVLREAAVLAAKLMGMNFVECNFESIPRDLKVDANTFFFSNMYMAGKQSPAAVTGMQVPHGADATLVTMLPEAYHLASKSGASMIVFEDITSAPPQVQTALHMMFDDHVPSEALRKIYFAYTGNLGKLDKTAATDLMSSLSTRVELHYTRTTALEYAKYISENPQFNGGALSDGLISGFMDIEGADLFDEIDSIGNRLNKKYCAPRTMNQFISSVRQELSRHLSNPNGATKAQKSQVVNLIQILAQNTVGLGKAAKLQSYYNSVLGDAYPIVQEVLNTGEISQESIKRCADIFGAGQTPEANSLRHAMLEAGSKFLGAKFAKALTSELNSTEKPETALCCKALNALTFGTINDAQFRTTMVRKTMVNMLRQLEKTIPKEVLNKKVGYVNTESGLVMDPFLSQLISDDLMKSAQKPESSTPYARSKAIVMEAFEAFVTTNQDIERKHEESVLNTRV